LRISITNLKEKPFFVEKKNPIISNKGILKNTCLLLGRSKIFTKDGVPSMDLSRANAVWFVILASCILGV
jgi:hypothetical protein